MSTKGTGKKVRHDRLRTIRQLMVLKREKRLEWRDNPTIMIAAEKVVLKLVDVAITEEGSCKKFVYCMQSGLVQMNLANDWP